MKSMIRLVLPALPPRNSTPATRHYDEAMALNAFYHAIDGAVARAFRKLLTP
jgi:hypothetical protein